MDRDDQGDRWYAGFSGRPVVSTVAMVMQMMEDDFSSAEIGVQIFEKGTRVSDPSHNIDVTATPSTSIVALGSKARSRT